MSAVPERPWHALPPAAGAALRPALPGLADEIIAALRDGLPEYARPLDGPFGAGLRAGVEAALRQFVDEIEAGGRGDRSEVYVDLGRGEWRAGRSLEVLLSAYRLGARVAWRRAAAAGAAAGLDPETLYLLAESIFAYIDELSAESAEGYALEQSRAAGAAQLRRRRLAALLVQDPPAAAEAVRAAAAAAGWPLPGRLAAVALSGGLGERAEGRLPAGTLTVAPGGDGEPASLLVPDPDGPARREALERALPDGGPAGLGPAVAWTEAAVSLRRARAVLALVHDGVVPPAPLVDAGSHAAALVLAADRRLASDLAREALAPLDALTPAGGARLRATLAAWLDEQGRLQPTAARLGVHPQTVRYRLARLRELLGGRLDDPDGRFELAVALRARQLAPAAGGELSSAP
ncbi:MAG: helix-turn-helix domain-containing protein [Solirubrobacteraceae bacterium]